MDVANFGAMDHVRIGIIRDGQYRQTSCRVSARQEVPFTSSWRFTARRRTNWLITPPKAKVLVMRWVDPLQDRGRGHRGYACIIAYDAGIAAFAAGLHLMVEKPISAHKVDAGKADRRTPEESPLVSRHVPARGSSRVTRRSALIRNGDLGEIVRVNWVNTDWFRGEAYHLRQQRVARDVKAVAGVLLNQCPY